MFNLYPGSKWVRYVFHVVGGTLFLPTYCFFGSCVSALIIPYHLDVEQWVRQNLPTMLLCGLFVFGASGLVAMNMPWPRLTRRLVMGVTALLLMTPVVGAFLLKPF